MRETYIVNLTSAAGKVITNQSQIPKSTYEIELEPQATEVPLNNQNKGSNCRTSWYWNPCAPCLNYNNKQTRTKSGELVTGGCGTCTGDIRNFCASDCGFRRCNEWDYASSFRKLCSKDCGFRCCCTIDCGNCCKNMCSKNCGNGKCFEAY